MFGEYGAVQVDSIALGLLINLRRSSSPFLKREGHGRDRDQRICTNHSDGYQSDMPSPRLLFLAKVAQSRKRGERALGLRFYVTLVTLLSVNSSSCTLCSLTNKGLNPFTQLWTCFLSDCDCPKRPCDALLGQSHCFLNPPLHRLSVFQQNLTNV